MPYQKILLVLIAMVTFAAVPTRIHAQRLAIPPINSGSKASDAVWMPPVRIPTTMLQAIRDSTVYRRSYWQEGLAAGAAVGLLLGALAGGTVCSISETSTSGCGIAALKGALLLGAPGASVGALIGGLFSKPDQ